MAIKKEVAPQEPWDKKKIIIAILSVLVLFFAFMYIKDSMFSTSQKSVKGEFTQRYQEQDKRISKASEKFQERLNKIQQNVNSLDVVGIASSSPQVQKVLADIKSLQSLPKNEAREACERICSGI